MGAMPSRPTPVSKRARRARRNGRCRRRRSSLAAAVTALLAGVTAGALYMAGGTIQVKAADNAADSLTGSVYVALGDSYSSGEGAPPYLPNGCDQSSASWVNVFAQGLRLPVVNDACTGATTADVISQGQLDSLGTATQLVTITAGGDDLGFGPVLRSCVTGEGCVGSVLQSCVTGGSCTGLNIPQNTLDALRATLHGLYQQIVAWAPNATLLVPSYPDIWPPNNQPCAPETGLLGSAQIQDLHTDTALLNQTIQSATYGVPRTYYIDSNTDPLTNTPAWTGVDVCASSQAKQFNGLMDLAGMSISTVFHPNAVGYTHWASIMLNYAAKLGIGGTSSNGGGGTGGGGAGGGGGTGGGGRRARAGSAASARTAALLHPGARAQRHGQQHHLLLPAPRP
jgi:lysophospholipase L1-like esterase